MQNLKNPGVPSCFRGKNKILVQAWYLTWLLLFRISPHALNFWRVFVLKLFGSKISYSTKIRPSAFISYPWNFSCGEYSYIGDYVFIDSLDKICVGNNVSISNRAYITSGTHNYKLESFDLILSPVIIESESWLSVNSTVMPGVKVGRGAILGAASLLTKSTGDNEIWFGVPAKKYSDR